MTNADKIRNMSNEELAEFLIKLTEIVQTCDICEPEEGDEYSGCYCKCELGVINWLCTEVKE